MLVYNPTTTCFAAGSLESEIQKFLASGKLADTISALPPEQLVRITAKAIEGQAEVQWKMPLDKVEKQLAIERHNASFYRKELAALRQEKSAAREGYWRRATLLAMRLFPSRSARISPFADDHLGSPMSVRIAR
jgi:hypothetical protein